MTRSAVDKGFRALTVGTRYRSSSHNVVREFYLPVLSAATRYSRAVGYFTSTSLAMYARGIDDFASRGGKMRLVASPHLNEDDIADIDRGYEAREVAERAVLRELEADLPDQVLTGLGVIGRLVADGQLDIKLAFVERDGLAGIYHEKIGVFRDDHGDLIAFTGSANETMGGLSANFESVVAFRGWLPGDSDRALEIERDFEDLWANTTPSLAVIPFPQVGKDRLLEIASSRKGAALPGNDSALEPEAVVTEPADGLILPDGITPRDYQRQAVEAWLGQRGRGMLKMATGTGKTKTALFAAYQLNRALRRNEQPLVIVIVVPYQHLVDQWIPDVEAFGVRPVGVYESSKRWQAAVEDQLAEVRFGRRPVMVMVATNASFAGDRFQNILQRVSQQMLIIADEAHNLGSGRYRAALPSNAQYRLALSATPERWLDDEGTQALSSYFGPVAFELSLEQAIGMGALCRYRYHPRLVELTDEENDLYVSLTAQIARLIAAGDSADDDADSPLGRLLRRRAGVLGHADRKLRQLASDMLDYRDEWFQLVYCAEGRKPSEDPRFRSPTQVAQVINLLGNQLDVAAHSYVSDTPRAERKELLRRFGTGDDLRALVAMKCLDEGVDIPDARIAYLLASSSNPRQFIQRRGRILRRAPGKSHAEIIDYVAVPKDGTPLNFEVERRLLIRELERVNEFAKLADNYEETLLLLRPLKETYQLMDM